MKLYIMLIFILSLLINKSSIGQVLTDDILYEKGYNEVQNQNWPIACAYLFAYIQRNPVVFLKDKEFEKQVMNAYNSSNTNIEREKTWFQNELARKNAIISSLKERLHEPASTSQGLSSGPEIPPLKKPVHQPAQRKMIIYNGPGRPLSGQWQATLTSSSGSVFTGTLLIVTNEDVVTGTFTLSDNSESKITGMYDGENLALMRNTGVTTIQTYTLKRLDENRFSGLYKNEGRIPDDGKIELMR